MIVFLFSFVIYSVLLVTAPIWWDASAPAFCAMPDFPNDVSGKIVLAARDKACEFKDRALLAESLGAVGLIIGDYPTATTFDVPFMGPYEQDPTLENIPVVRVLGDVYLQITSQNGTGAGAVYHWQDTTATIDIRGLYADLEDYRALQPSAVSWPPFIRLCLNIIPI